MFRHTFSLRHQANVVGMVQENYDRSQVTLHTGERLELVNNSNFLHVVTVGDNGRIQREPGAPLIGGRGGLVTMWHGRRYWTPPWDTPGVYHLTCTLHTGMNLKVVVNGAAILARPGSGG